MPSHFAYPVGTINNRRYKYGRIDGEIEHILHETVSCVILVYRKTRLERTLLCEVTCHLRTISEVFLQFSYLLLRVRLPHTGN